MNPAVDTIDNVEAALVLCQEAFAVSHTGLFAFNAACCLCRLGRVEEGLDWLGRAVKAGYGNKTAIDEDPEFSDAYNAWGSALVEERKISQAIEKYREAIRLNRFNSAAYRNRAIAYRSNGEIDLAIADLEQAGRLSPTAQTYYDLGSSYEDANKFESCWPVLRRYFGEIRPAATMIEAKLAQPRMQIEIEVTALISRAGAKAAE